MALSPLAIRLKSTFWKFGNDAGLTKFLDDLLVDLPDVECRALLMWLSTFFLFQMRWLFDWSQLTITVKSRQIGASHTLGAKAVLWAMERQTTTIVSISQRDANEVLKKAWAHVLVLQDAGSQWAKGATQTRTEIAFSNGGRIISLPQTSGGRGYSGNVILDEFAYYDKPDEVWDAAAPATSQGYRLNVNSTPNGVGGMFYELWNDPKMSNGWSRHLVTVYQAIEDKMRIDLKGCWRMALNDPRKFAQMFEGTFTDADSQFLQTEIVNKAVVDYGAMGSNGAMFLPCRGNEWKRYAGLDIGKTIDLTALSIVSVDEQGIIWVWPTETRSRTSQADIDALAARALEKESCSHLTVDMTGMGAFPAEALQKRYGQWKVTTLPFSQQSKERMATTLYELFSSGRIRIPRIDKQLYDDLLSLRRIITDNNNVLYDAPRSSNGGHADRAWALAMALLATVGPNKGKYAIVQHSHEQYDDGEYFTIG